MSYPYTLMRKGKVVCQICGKELLIISPTHLKKHNLTVEQYQKRFPNAPSTSEIFNERSGRGKVYIPPPLKEENPVVDVNAIEELDIEEILKQEAKIDPVRAMKNRVLDQLKMHFNNIVKDHLVTQYGQQYSYQFEFITDFCDPVLRLIIDFPDVFWHNKEAYPDPNKKHKLESSGWKIVEIKKQNPSYEDIEEAIRLI